jgi:gamma-glutamylputrescine oxidase
LQGAITADLAIIGGGFTGTSTAYYVSRRFPNRRIVLLEAATLANGASGRNGGMMLNWVNGCDNVAPEMTARIYQMTRAGIDDALCADRAAQAASRLPTRRHRDDLHRPRPR